MLSRTKAIVLHKVNYSESSIIVNVFSEHFGKVGLLIQGAKRKNSNNKIALFEPLSLLEIVGNFDSPEKLIRPKEVKLYLPFINIQSSISKRTIALFLSEVLHKTIREPHPDQSTFNFVEKALIRLENTPHKTTNFHVIFLMELTKHLGFYPILSKGNYFDMLEGVFSDSVPRTNVYLTGLEKEVFFVILGTNFDEWETVKLNSEQRRNVLSSIITYYQTHISGLGEIKSHTVLETIFN